MTVAWLEGGLVHAAVGREVAGRLSALGLDIVDRPSRDAVPGVVVFESVSPALAATLTELSSAGRRRVVAVASSSGAVRGDVPWRLLEMGASDVVDWQGGGNAADVVARLERWAAVEDLIHSSLVRDQLVGTSAAWHTVIRQVVEIAGFTPASVLVTGESGTGKELVARLIHALDTRPGKGELVTVDCTTVVPTLSGSEFFGHERGAFTGATAATATGRSRLADNGTLFLDEVGELPLPMQAELLRVVQEGMYKRVGSNVWQRTRFRLVCATNRDLLSEQASGNFRRDFYYRIAASLVRLPPLRDRTEDIVPLFVHFLGQLHRSGPPPLEDVVSDLLRGRDYPGNVRDLRQLALRVSNRHVGPGAITAGDIPEEERPSVSGSPGTWRDDEPRRADPPGAGARRDAQGSPRGSRGGRHTGGDPRSGQQPPARRPAPRCDRPGPAVATSEPPPAAASRRLVRQLPRRLLRRSSRRGGGCGARVTRSSDESALLRLEGGGHGTP